MSNFDKFIDDFSMFGDFAPEPQLLPRHIIFARISPIIFPKFYLFLSYF